MNVFQFTQCKYNFNYIKKCFTVEDLTPIQNVSDERKENNLSNT